MQLRRLFTEHPESVGETYWQHMGMALSFAGRMLAASVCCAVHGLFPFLFERTGSRCIENLHDRMVDNRSRHAERDLGDQAQRPA